MNRFFVVAALLGLLSIAGRAEAGYTFTVQGTFGSPAPHQGATGAEGGSFLATVTVDYFPTSSSQDDYLDSFSVSISDSNNNLLDTFGSTTPNNSSLYYGAIYQELVLEAPGYGLRLYFGPDFTGTGPVIYTDNRSGSVFLTYDGNGNITGDTEVASGMSAPGGGAVPEPSSIVMVSMAGMIGLGVARFRRRKTVARA